MTYFICFPFFILPLYNAVVLFFTLLTIKLYSLWVDKSVYLAPYLQLRGWLFILTYSFFWIVMSGIEVDSSYAISFEFNSFVFMHTFVFISLSAHALYIFNYRRLSDAALLVLLVVALWMIWPRPL